MEIGPRTGTETGTEIATGTGMEAGTERGIESRRESGNVRGTPTTRHAARTTTTIRATADGGAEAGDEEVNIVPAADTTSATIKQPGVPGLLAGGAASPPSFQLGSKPRVGASIHLRDTFPAVCPLDPIRINSLCLIADSIG